MDRRENISYMNMVKCGSACVENACGGGGGAMALDVEHLTINNNLAINKMTWLPSHDEFSPELILKCPFPVFRSCDHAQTQSETAG